MRTGRRLPWLIYAVCVLLVVDGLAWATWQMLSLERREHVAQADSQRQESVRLALWRMDGLLSPVIAAESARPYFHYRSFYPAGRAYSDMWDEIGPDEVLAASPLLAGPGEFIRLHFESTPGGWLTSPQAPDPELRDRAQSVAVSLPDVLTVERELSELTAVLRGLPSESLQVTEAGTRSGQVSVAEPQRLELQLDEAGDELQAFAVEERDREVPELLRFDDDGAPITESAADGSDRSIGEYQARQRNAWNARDFVDSAVRKGGDVGDAAAPLPGSGGIAASKAAGGPERVQTGRFAPVWRTNPVSGEPELIFVRAVTVGDRTSTQGFWIDWPGLRSALLGSVGDLLPGAELVPIVRDGVEPVSDLDSALHSGRLLAGVPAVLVPGVAEIAPLRGLTPTRTVLVVTWVAVLAAVVAIALVLRASLALSARRGRFVSAVTHELRTPLTTFCLYSQMLDDGMVTDESRRGEYVGTLRRESERLAGIVENVLAYARIGSRTADAPPSEVTELLAGMTESLGELAERCGMRLEVDVEGIGGVRVACDRGSLERVLGNLVDNACKYAAGAEDRRITLRVRPERGGVEFRVRDRGPGVPSGERRRIFSPFSRGRSGAGDGSSGLGLGLALARGVARSLGGDLRLGRGSGPGAEFVLWLPGASA